MWLISWVCKKINFVFSLEFEQKRVDKTGNWGEVNYFRPLPVFLRVNIRPSSSPLRLNIVLHLKVVQCNYRKQGKNCTSCCYCHALHYDEQQWILQCGGFSSKISEWLSPEIEIDEILFWSAGRLEPWPSALINLSLF